jgi:3-oxoacyl-[acyl-carrier-protein] synthase III
MKTVIESLGVYLPPRSVTSAEVLQGCTHTLLFPFKRYTFEGYTGIRSRRMAGETEFAIDLARRAVEDCLAGSRHGPEDIDLLVCCSISRCDGPHFETTFEPAASIRLKHDLGFTRALTFDVSNACAGMFTGIQIADTLLARGTIRRAMVVSGEYVTHLTLTAQRVIRSFLDSRLACFTLGDAGAAVVLERADAGGAGFHEIDLFTLGRHSDLCVAHATDDGPMMFTEMGKMQDAALVPSVRHLEEVLSRCPLRHEEFSHLVMHQTSRSVLREAVRVVSRDMPWVPQGRTHIDNLADRGNTASTSHFVALMDQSLGGRIRSGQSIAFSITGSGLTLGSALYTLDDLPDRLRRRRASNEPPAARAAGAAPAPVPAAPATTRVRIASTGTLSPATAAGKPSVELGRLAAEECLGRWARDRSDIGLLLFAGTYRTDTMLEPALAALVAGQLGLNDTFESSHHRRTLAFDVWNGGVGFLNACFVAAEMIQARKTEAALVVTSETETNHAAARHRRVVETGSALLLERSAGAGGFGRFLFRSFTEHIGALTSRGRIEGGRRSLDVRRDPRLDELSVACVAAVVRDLLAAEALDISQVKAVLPPQVSSAFIGRLADALGVSRDRCIDVTVDGLDLFSSSLPHALREAERRSLLGAGDAALLIGVGAGLQVGCAVYHF